jgi:hypothetical protein
LLLLAILGCRPVVDIEKPEDYGYSRANFSTAFESFWIGMNVNYLFWNLEPADYWDAVWDTYKPKFDALASRDFSLQDDLNKARTEAYQYFKEMTMPLRDGHLCISFQGFPDFSPRELAVAKRYLGITDNTNPKRAFWSNLSGVPYAEYPAFVNYDFLSHTIKNYINPQTGLLYHTLPHNNQHPAVGFRAMTGHIATSQGGFILYGYFSGFAIAANAEKAAFGVLVEQYVQDIKDPDLQGVIIDLRGNTGGAASDIDLVLNRFIHEPLLFAYTRYKNGPNRLDYKPWVPYYIYPHPYPSERVKNDIPVVALINDYSISCGELTPLAIKALPKGYLIGTRTYGATGPRFSDTIPEVTNGGSFSNTSGNTFWNNVLQAGIQTKARDGAIYEGIGISPDKTVAFNWSEFYGDGRGSGRDRQLEAAIRHIDPAWSAP